MEEWMKETKNGNMLELRKRCAWNAFCQLFAIAALPHASQVVQCYFDILTSDVLLYFLCRDRRPGKTPGVPPWGLEAAAACSLGDAAIPHGSPQEVWTWFHFVNCKLIKIQVFSLKRLSFSLTPSISQGDPEREGEPDVQREPGHCVRSDADEGSRAGRHDGAEWHPIPETCGGKPHHQWRRALLRGEKRTLPVRRGWRIRLGRLLTSSVLQRFMTLNKINEEETCKNQKSGLARADKRKKHYLFLMRTGWKEQWRKLFARVTFLRNNCE